MTTAWRVVKARRASEAFTGEGARRYGGRWNPPGIPIVYAADTLALAVLELFVHLGPAHARLRFVTLRVEIPDGLRIESVGVATIPSTWRSEPPSEETQAIGAEWVRRGTSAVLRVPSVLIPSETDYVLNPRHPDFPRIVVSRPEPFGFDPRMWK